MPSATTDTADYMREVSRLAAEIDSNPQALRADADLPADDRSDIICDIVSIAAEAADCLPTTLLNIRSAAAQGLTTWTDDHGFSVSEQNLPRLIRAVLTTGALLQPLGFRTEVRVVPDPETRMGLSRVLLDVSWS